MVELQLLAAWLVSGLALSLGGQVPCNTTVELGPGAGARLERPAGGQGEALTCWYTLRLTQGMQGGLISVHVDRFSVGRLEGGKCVGGHLRIEDGGPAVPAQGLHCGETELPKRVVRQAAQVTLTFHVEKIDRTVEWAMDVSALRKAEVPERFGKMPELFPGKVGAVVQETYCETVFQDCRVQQCNVQSPGFPGVYPRGLACRYYISTAASLIRLYVDRPYWQAFNVDGWRCENLRDCPARELATGEKNCPWDWIKLYDGVDEYSPLIGHFCGTGSFPVSIIGTGNKLFLEFVTSEAGPLLNTGFDFRVTSVPGSGPSTNGSCHQVVTSSDLTADEGSFISLEHWYSPGRNCSYLLSGEPNQRVRLHFEKMKMTQKTPIRQDLNDDCSEYLVLYDSSWPDPRAVLKAFCNGFSPPSENIDFLSTGSSLLVSFISLSGSYSGSSIYYWAIYSFHDARPDGEPVAGSLCDERISTAGQFRSPRNSLVFRQGGPLVCTYFLEAGGQQFSRLELTLGPVDFSRGQEGCSRGCRGNTAIDRLEVEEVGEGGNTSLACISSCVAPHSTTVISQGPFLQLSLRLGSATPASSYYGRKAPLFTALLRFLHPAVCGPTSLSGQEPGSLDFPVLGQGQGGRYREVTCVWSLSLREGRQVGLTMSNLTLGSEDCGQHSLTIARGEGQGQVLHRECGQSRGQGAEVEVPAAGPPSLTITLHMANLGLGGLSLAWKYT